MQSIEQFDFEQWRRRAKRAIKDTETTYRAHGKANWREGVWGDLKRHLFDLFNGKCAYCEVKVQSVEAGQVEHYRPRSPVKENAAHPGYYWLAYEPSNLLPACGICNGAEGKGNHFPIDGDYTTQPTESVAQERPLLLNPYTDTPLEHLKFLPTGGVEAETRQGEVTIKLCKLQRHTEDRRGAQEQLATDIDLEISSTERLTSDALKKVYMRKLEILERGDRPFTAALTSHLLHLCNADLARLDERVRKGALALEALTAAIEDGRTAKRRSTPSTKHGASAKPL